MLDFPEKNPLVSTLAFEKLFKAQYKLLTYQAMKYLKDISAAEEIVQDVFVRLWEKREAIVITGSIHAYLAVSVRNSCFNYLKHQRIVDTYERNAISGFLADPSLNEENMGDMEFEGAVLKAIEQLPPQRKRVFIMSRIDGLKYQEIADKMGLSIKTIEVQMGKALKQMRSLLKDFLVIVIGLFLVGLL